MSLTKSETCSLTESETCSLTESETLFPAHCFEEWKNEIRDECKDFYNLNIGSKAKAADILFLEKKINERKEQVYIDTIIQMDEELELQDKKIQNLKQQLTNLTNQYKIDFDTIYQHEI